MATVVSLTKAKIEELMAGWEAVGLSQDEINSLVTQLVVLTQSQAANLEEFNEVVLPVLRADLDAGAIAVSDLLANQLPQLQADLVQADLEIQNLVTVVVPALQNDVVSTIENALERPYVYVQDDPPENPDPNERYLVVGDSWFDNNDGNKQRVWNGVEWSTFNVDVADFSLTARKFLTNTHQIY